MQFHKIIEQRKRSPQNILRSWEQVDSTNFDRSILTGYSFIRKKSFFYSSNKLGLYRNWENCSSDSLNQYFASMEYQARKICIIQSTPKQLKLFVFFPSYVKSLCLTEYRYSVAALILLYHTQCTMGHKTVYNTV